MTDRSKRCADCFYEPQEDEELIKDEENMLDYGEFNYYCPLCYNSEE